MRGQLRQMACFIMNGQHLARQQFHLAHAHHVQRRIGHPGDEAQRLDALGGLARQRAVGRGHVVDGDDGQFVLVCAAAQLAQKPVTVGGGHGAVFLAARVPALEQ